MSEGPAICAAILAAGQSRRFGFADKLSQPLGERRLGTYIANAILPLDLAHRIVIVSDADHPCIQDWSAAGFKTCVNQYAQRGMGSSVALAAQKAAERGADALLICLADMPFVGTDDLRQLLDMHAASNSVTITAASNGEVASPPAIFGKHHFPRLQTLDGADGAREMLRDAETIVFAQERLMDIDTRQELEWVAEGKNI